MQKYKRLYSSSPPVRLLVSSALSDTASTFSQSTFTHFTATLSRPGFFFCTCTVPVLTTAFIALILFLWKGRAVRFGRAVG